MGRFIQNELTFLRNSSNELTLVNTVDQAILSIKNIKGEEKDLILALQNSQINVPEIKEITVEDNIYGKNELIISLILIFRTYVNNNLSFPLQLNMEIDKLPTIYSYEKSSVLYH